MNAAAVAGVGLGWRGETAWACERRESLGFAEVVAESVPTEGPLPRALERLLERGVPVVTHGVSLSLGGADPPDARRLARLRRVCERLGSPIVGEHVAFVRGAGKETDHLLPIPRTRAALEVVIENVSRAQDALGAPLALENVAHLFEWPRAELGEGELLAEIVRRTGARLLLDASNMHANAINHGLDVGAFLDALPLDRVAYVHTAGGVTCDGFRHDTHAHELDEGALAALGRVLARTGPVPILLERDDGFGTRAALEGELDRIGALLARAAGSPEARRAG